MPVMMRMGVDFEGLDFAMIVVAVFVGSFEFNGGVADAGGRRAVGGA